MVTSSKSLALMGDKMRIKVILASICIIALLLAPACAKVKKEVEEAVEAVQPTVEVTDIALRDVSLTSITVDVTVSVSNPNPIDINLDRLDYDVYFPEEGTWKHLGSGGKENILIAANTTSEFEAPTTISMASLARAIYQLLLREGTIDLRVSGTAYVKAGPAIFKVPIEKVEKVSL